MHNYARASAAKSKAAKGVMAFEGESKKISRICINHLATPVDCLSKTPDHLANYLANSYAKILTVTVASAYKWSIRAEGLARRCLAIWL